MTSPFQIRLGLNSGEVVVGALGALPAESAGELLEALPGHDLGPVPLESDDSEDRDL